MDVAYGVGVCDGIMVYGGGLGSAGYAAPGPASNPLYGMILPAPTCFLHLALLLLNQTCKTKETFFTNVCPVCGHYCLK